MLKDCLCTGGWDVCRLRSGGGDRSASGHCSEDVACSLLGGTSKSATSTYADGNYSLSGLICEDDCGYSET